jgi:hypothetical protein
MLNSSTGLRAGSVKHLNANSMKGDVEPVRCFPLVSMTWQAWLTMLSMSLDVMLNGVKHLNAHSMKCFVERTTDT